VAELFFFRSIGGGFGGCGGRSRLVIVLGFFLGIDLGLGTAQLGGAAGCLEWSFLSLPTTTTVFFLPTPSLPRTCLVFGPESEV